MLVKGGYGYDLVPPERFELPAPAFVAQCSNPNELRWCIEFVSSATIVIGTIHPCNKLERDSVRHLRYSSSLPPLQASAVPRGWELNPLPSAVKVVRTYLRQRDILLLTLTKLGGSGEIRTHGPFRIVCFQDRCNKPDSATLPYLEQRVGFEPTALEFCRLLHWTTLPPLHDTGAL